MMKKLLFTLLAFPVFAQAQNASIQDCLGAIPVCDRIYQEDLSPIGFGNVMEMNGAINCNPIEQNSIWYIFTVNETGKFGFVLTPNVASDDYDWSLFDITNANCEDIQSDMALMVSCNAAGSVGCHGATGATGDSQYNIQGANCDNNPPTLSAGFSPFNDLVDVQKGNTYVLFINNFTGSTNGYTLDFGLSADIGIFDETDPILENAALADACDGAQIELQFSEFIQCATISNFNFRLDGPGGPYTLSLSSTNCDAGGNYSKIFFLDVTPPLTTGNFTLSLDADGSSDALDLCGNPSAPVSFAFAGPSLMPTLDLGPDTTLCAGNSLLLDAGSLPGSYMWSDGSTTPTLTVSTPGVYSVEVTTGCGIATDAIQVSFSGSAVMPDLGPDTTLCAGETIILDATTPGAVYQWSDGSTGPTLTVSQAGNYSVTVSSDCGAGVDAITIGTSSPITATLDPVSLCPGDEHTWDVSTPGATYQWQDGSVGPTFSPTATGTYSVTITNSCGTQTLSANVEMGTLLPDIDLGNDTTLCNGESLMFDFSGFAGLSFEWQDGATAATYTITQRGTYSLTLSNDCDMTEDAITVSVPEPIMLDIGADTILCPGDVLMVDASSPNADYYFWQDNSNDPAYVIDRAGVFTVTAGNDCEEVSADIRVTECTNCKVFIPNSFSPNNDGVNDEFRAFSNCPFDAFQLKVFDRWGTLLYQSPDPDSGWNGMSGGQYLHSGVYLWMMTYRMEEDSQTREMKQSGEVTILR